MTDLSLWIAERIATTPPSAPLRALTALWEVHRSLHPCSDSEGISGLHGGRDRPTCASLRLVATAWDDAPPGHPPIRTVSDLERLGPLGLKADVLAYGEINIEDSPRARAAVEQWAQTEGVVLRWHEL